MNNEFKDYYKILGVTPTASFQNIEAARTRELSYFGRDIRSKMDLEEAYNVLSNPETRKAYDIIYNKVVSDKERELANARTYEEFLAIYLRGVYSGKVIQHNLFKKVIQHN